MTDLRPVRTAEAVSELEGSVYLYDGGRQEVQILNPPAAAVWRLCDGTRDVGTIVTELAGALAEAGSPVPAELRVDVEATVGELARAGLVAIRRPEPADPV